MPQSEVYKWFKTFNHYLNCSRRWVSEILEISSLSNFTWDFFQWEALSRILSPRDLICGQIHVYFKIECFKMDREMTFDVKWQLTVASTLACPLALGVGPHNASSALWVWYILFIWHRNLLWYAVLDHKHWIGMCMWYVWHNLGFTLRCVRCGLIRHYMFLWCGIIK